MTAIWNVCIADCRDSVAKIVNLSVDFKSSGCNLSITLEVIFNFSYAWTVYPVPLREV